MVVRTTGLVLVVGWLLAGAARGDDKGGGNTGSGSSGDAAAAYEPPDFMAEVPALPASTDAAAAWRLDLAEALRLAVHGNLGLAIERESVAIAGLGVAIARGGFEPIVTASAGHGSDDSPPITAVQGQAEQIVTTTGDDWSLSISQRLATGMVLGAGFVSARSRSTAADAIQPTNYRSTLSLSVSQPLLRGFSLDLVVPRIEILRAEIASERERRQLAVAAVDVVQRTEAAYWDVVQALYTYDLVLRSRRRAEDQLALTHRQIAAGLTPPSDLLSAETTLAQRKLRLVQAEQDIEQTSDQLRAILHLPRDQWARPILPTDPPRFVAEASRAEDMLAVAIAHRPELAQLDLDLRAAELAVRKADNARLPQIDLGLSGALVGQGPAYGDALDQLSQADAKGYRVLLQLTWTPLDRAAGASAEIERAQQRIAAVRRDQALQDIWLAVRNAVRDQRSAQLQVAAAAQFRALSTQSLEVEQRKFLNGTSSNFVVAQRQEELANAQQAEVAAVLAHKKATAALLRATGRLLEARHIDLGGGLPAPSRPAEPADSPLRASRRAIDRP